MCSSVFDQIRGKVREVDILMAYKILKPGKESSFEVNRSSYLREQKRLSQLQSDLRHARLRILSLLGHLNIRETTAIEVLVNDVSSTSRRTRTDMLNSLSTLTQGQTKIEDAVGQILARIPPYQESPNASSMLRTRMNSATDNIAITVARTRNRNCSCPRPRILSEISTCLGRLFIGYAAAPVLARHQRTCDCKGRAELIITYCFPTWLLYQALSLHIKYSKGEHLSCSLSMKQVVPFEHPIFSMVKRGDIEGMKEAFQSGQISPDARDIYGSGLILVCCLCLLRFH